MREGVMQLLNCPKSEGQKNKKSDIFNRLIMIILFF